MNSRVLLRHPESIRFTQEVWDNQAGHALVVQCLSLSSAQHTESGPVPVWLQQRNGCEFIVNPNDI